MKVEQQERFKELKEHEPCKHEDVLEISIDPEEAEDMEEAEEYKQEVKQKLNDYLEKFLPPSSECYMCGDPLRGLLGSFEMGIAHGEGQCSSCGYPGRIYHKVDGLGTFGNYVLQYHPNVLELKKRGESS